MSENGDHFGQNISLARLESSYILYSSINIYVVDVLKKQNKIKKINSLTNNNTRQRPIHH